MNLRKLLKLLLTWLQKTSGMHLEQCPISQITTRYYGGVQGDSVPGSLGGPMLRLQG